MFSHTEHIAIGCFPGLKDISVSQSGRTALMCAATGGHAECMRLLLEAGADKEAVEYVRGKRCDSTSRSFAFTQHVYLACRTTIVVSVSLLSCFWFAQSRKTVTRL
jgi:ankyrin repeat protein